MKLLYACDIHTNRRHVKTLLNIAVRSGVNAVAIGGDVTPKVIFDKYGFDKLVYEQRKYLEDEFVPILRDFKKAHTTINLYLDLGNDDFKANRDVLEKHEGELFHLLHMTVGRLTEDIDIVGFMDVPVTPFTIKDWEKADKKKQYPPVDSTIKGYVSRGSHLLDHVINVFKDTSIEEELAELGKQITKPFIFVCHTPPYMTKLDQLYSGRCVGSTAVREFIEYWAVKGLLKAGFHGHIHESPKVSGSTVDYVAGVRCYNPGQTERKLQYMLWECAG